MARLLRFESQGSTRVTAGLLSTVMHVGLLVLVAFSGGPGEGEREDPTPAEQWVRLDAPAVIPRAGMAEMPLETGSVPPGSPQAPRIEPPPVPFPEPDIPSFEGDEGVLADAEVTVEEPADLALAAVADTFSSFVTPAAQVPALLERIETLAEELTKAPRARVRWEHDGRHYDAVLVLESGGDGLEPERAIAEISTEDQGRRLRTRINLKRLPFSHYAKVIDRWDPMVQLHDDEILGRMHINSRFNVLYDSLAAPKLLGKVTTAASGVNVKRLGRRPDSDVFTEGIETRAGRIPFSGEGWSFELPGRDSDARVHPLAGHTHIRFLAAGGYSWRDGASGSWQHAGPPEGQDVYFVAASDAIVYVRGVVRGRFLVYSPRRIVVEDDLTYARDPRIDPDSGDFLGLVCDRDIVVAPPDVTGDGDLNIQAALFARRRMVVADSGHRGAATLNIYGSLAAGTLSESEPRYAMRVEYDPRFEQRRPPGFPSTNRFTAQDWDRQWTEIPERSAAAGF